MHCCSEAYALARLSSGESCVLIVMNIDRIHYPLVPRVIATCSSTDRDQTLRNDEVVTSKASSGHFIPLPENKRRCPGCLRVLIPAVLTWDSTSAFWSLTTNVG